MNRITKWIQERKEYSNPTFGTMLILSAMTFPVFQASGRLAEPVQPMAQTAEQVVDALDAVEAGVSVDEAFNIQPIPFRDFVKFNKTISDTLFDDAFDVSKAGYYLDDEINEGDVFFDFIGSTIIDNEFIIRFASLTNVDLAGGSLTPDDIASLAEHDSNILSFVGTMSTAISTINIAGLVWQGTRLDDNERVRFLFILDTVNQSFIDDLEWVYFQPQFIDGDAGPAIDCAQALVDAANEQLADLEDAIGTYNTCVKNMNNQLIAELAICTGGGAVGVTFLTRWIAPLVTLVAMGGCGIAATVRAQLALNTCFNAYENTRDAIARAYDRAVQAAHDAFGDDCPDIPT
mgnify:CR=1 FL=1